MIDLFILSAIFPNTKIVKSKEVISSASLTHLFNQESHPILIHY